MSDEGPCQEDLLQDQIKASQKEVNQLKQALERHKALTYRETLNRQNAHSAEIRALQKQIRDLQQQVQQLQEERAQHWPN